MKCVPEDLVCGSGRRRQFFLCAFWQFKVGKQGCDLLARIRIINIILEYQRDDREPKHRLRTKIDFSLYTIHRDLDRDRHKALHFLCTPTRPSCNNANLRVCKIREGDNGCSYETKDSNYGKSPRHKKSEHL